MGTLRRAFAAFGEFCIRSLRDTVRELFIVIVKEAYVVFLTSAMLS